MGELNSNPAMLRKSKFDNVNANQFWINTVNHCIYPKSTRDIPISFV
jgi:hypothetical protein